MNKKQHNKFTKVFDIKDHETLTALKTSKGYLCKKVNTGDQGWGDTETQVKIIHNPKQKENEV